MTTKIKSIIETVNDIGHCFFFYIKFNVALSTSYNFYYYSDKNDLN